MGKTVEGELLELNPERNFVKIKVQVPESHAGEVKTFALNYKDLSKGAITKIESNDGKSVKLDVTSWVFDKSFPTIIKSEQSPPSPQQSLNNFARDLNFISNHFMQLHESLSIVNANLVDIHKKLSEILEVLKKNVSEIRI